MPTPFLDTHEYMFTFDDGDETVLNANLIAEAMYAQCDPNGNQYVFLDSIFDHRLWECLTAVCKALSLANAKGKGTDGLVIRS